MKFKTIRVILFDSMGLSVGSWSPMDFPLVVLQTISMIYFFFPLVMVPARRQCLNLNEEQPIS